MKDALLIKLSRLLFFITLLSLGLFQSSLAQNWAAYEEETIIKIPGIMDESQIKYLVHGQKQVTRQYLDGLGRPIQTIAIKSSPNENDIIVPIVYDNQGRTVRNYLPYAANDGTGFFRPSAITEQATFYNSGVNGKIAADPSPYSQVSFEDSPLGRILKQGMPGDGFQLNQHSKSANYRFNTASELIRVWSSQGLSTSTYPVNTLSVQQITDEQGVSILIYTDNSGKVILKRQPTNQAINGVTEINLDTYYIYNENGSISYAVSPKATASMRISEIWDITQPSISNMMFKFIYDTRGRLTQKTVPEGPSIYLVYDPLSRLVLVQDGNMRLNNNWNYLKYDAKGRVMCQGIYKDDVNTSLATMQTYVNSLNYNSNYYEKRRSTELNYGYYTNNSFPTINNIVPQTALQPLGYFYYDDYDLNLDGTPDFSYQAQGLSGEEIATSQTRGMLTVSSKTTIGSGVSANKWLKTVVFYNKNGISIQTQENNHTNTGESLTDVETAVVDFSGKILQQKKSNAIYNASKTILTSYHFDKSSRLKSIDQSYNSATPVRIAAYTYNELGQTVYKQLHSKDAGSTFMQGLDYRYNIRGQLLSMNNSTLSASGNNTLGANALFGLEVLYDKVDSAPNSLNNTPYFNGLTSAIKWMANVGGANKIERSYKYSYDDQNRIKDALYADRVVGQGIWGNIGAYDEKDIKYDHNGNILTLQRKAMLSGSIQSVDDLQYSYIGNKLNAITDGAGINYTQVGFKNATGSSSSYNYDANGNITIDPYKGISTNYNILNRTNQVNITTTTGRYINYTYDSNAQLIKKQQYEGGVLSTTTDYIDGYTYENAALTAVKMPEGRMVNSGADVLKPEYFITDQQGNVRLSFQEVGNTGVAQIKQENSYYPFGLIMPNSQVAVPTMPNRNLYNGGSEWQNDYGDLPDLYQTYFRSYDPAIGRFTGVDPRAESSESLSPYHYAGNNPIMYNDPLGDDFHNWDDVHAAYTKLKDSDQGGFATGSDDRDIHYYTNRQDALTGMSSKLDRAYGYGGSDGRNSGGGKSSEPKFIFSSSKYYDTDLDVMGVEIHGERNRDWLTEMLDEDKKKEDPKPYYGHFLGPGPDGVNANPYNLKGANGQILRPIDLIDAAAQRHDYAYWKIGVSGVKGALFDKKVRAADAQLAIDAAGVIADYYRGTIDPYTGKLVSWTTFNWAVKVAALFGEIAGYKKILNGFN